ncbi:Sau3AI family type II restriction endonuclease [Bifidobacterium cebidarum]|uniref:DNA mismatch repair protein MutH n=1 Tax=Bifidobacterium cebidarum TaxID=2650773 RepID=A0A6I1GB78_9BIFI|nr:Sau3AI family type II restriction endonuclease [Bifidobacterium cebidarum]KAB7788815.1 DNA mismatch repair protein MutH [Bifidobacterium cebidarum]
MGQHVDANLNESRSYSTLEEVMGILTGAAGKTFRELDKTGRAEALANKGALGNIIEESVLGYPVNSDAEADIQIGNSRYELKVTPLKHVRKGKETSAKERLVIDIINYMKLVQEKDFESSQMWGKAKNIILVYYYDDRTDTKRELRVDCTVLLAYLMQYSPEDVATIRQDWKLIRDKVASGHADELSESDTNYLAACTKGANASTLRDAPAPLDSPKGLIRAKQRAFSFKTSYMTAIARRLLHSDSGESLRLAPEQALEDYLRNKFSRYFGKTTGAIARDLGLMSITPKQFNSQLALGMIGSKQKAIGKVEQFAKANVTGVKTIVMYEGVDRPQEHMSFRQISEEEWAELGDASVEWHDSFLYQFFEENRFLFMVFRASGMRRSQSSKTADIFTDAFLWNMPEADIEKYVRPVWEWLHEAMVAKKPLHYGRGTNELPGPSFNNVFHIRPKGKDGNDTVLLPNGERITKQAFWLDRRYVAKIVSSRYGWH